MRNFGGAFGVTLLLLLSGLLLFPRSGQARHAKDKAEQEHAARLREEGATALVENRLEDARRALYESYERHPESQTLYFLGQLAAASGRPIEAQDLLRRFLREMGDDVDAKQREAVNRILSQPISPYGELDINGDRGAIVRVDGRILGVLPLSQPLLLAGGNHTVHLDQGSRRLEGPVEIQVGRTAQLRFDLQTDVAVVTLPPTVLLLQDYRVLLPGNQNILSFAVEQAIRAEQLAVLSSQAALLRAPELAPCLHTLPCQAQLMQRSEVDFSLLLFVQPTPDGSAYVLHGEILDAATGDAALKLDQPLDFNQLGQATAMASSLVTRLLKEGRTRPHGTLEVNSTPPGAEVVLPRGPVGVTPYQHAVFAGPTDVTVQKLGYQPAYVSVNVEPGSKGAANVVLLPVEKKGLARLPRWRLITGIVAVSVGGLAFSIGLLTASSQGGASSGIAGASSGVSGGSIAALAIGGAIAAGGVLLLTLPVSRPKAAPPPPPAPN
jgi:hypothetical protein